MPGRYVGPYAETDAVRTLEAFKLLQPTLTAQKLEDAYRLEMDLVPTIRAMRSRGVAIDVDKAEQHRRDFRAKRDAALAEIARNLPGRGTTVTIDDLRTTKWLEPTFRNEGVALEHRTAASKKHPDGQISFSQDWMERDQHWLPKLVSRALQCDAMAEKFMGTFILDFTHRGRIHAEIHQYKSDDGGTVSYRFSYSNPPLQQAPSPDMNPEYGTPFREVFVADGIWGASDYSQQEYRLTAHFAALLKVRGGEEAAKKFRDDPDLDYHKMVAEVTGLGRPKAKIQNFALLYGQGLDSTAAKLGISKSEAEEIRNIVAEKAPFGPALDEFVKQLAQSRGYLKLLDGARVRFDEWEAGWISRETYLRGVEEKRPMTPCSLEEARARTKLAMRECAREKLIPVLQMHDELDHDEDSEAKIRRVADIMRGVVKLTVPMKVDTGLGSSWAAAKAKDEKPAVVVVPRGSPKGDGDLAGARGLEKQINKGKS
jgi:DNA polymerase-1